MANEESRRVSQDPYEGFIIFYNMPSLNETCRKRTFQIGFQLQIGIRRTGRIIPHPGVLQLHCDVDFTDHLVQKIKTPTIQFHGKGIDENPYARKVAEFLPTDHHEYFCTQKEASEIILELPFIFDALFRDISSIPTELMNRLVGRKAKVSLSSNSCNGIFGGHNGEAYLSKIKHTDMYIPTFLRITASFIMRRLLAERIKMKKKG